MIIVPGYGRLPNPVMLVGEAPGASEAHHKDSKGNWCPRPFVGKSGQEQDAYLYRHSQGSLSSRAWRLTNVVKEYTEGNPDPTPEQIARATPDLLAEITACNPRLIIAAGRFATRWFLGEDAEMEMVHGLPHRAGAFDPTRANRAPEGCIVLPIYHPAAGFYDSDLRAYVDKCYAQVVRVWGDIKVGKDIPIPSDRYQGKETYYDISGSEVPSVLTGNLIAIDTEGIPSNPWSVQFTCVEGRGYCLRRTREDFAKGTEYLRRYVGYSTSRVILHNALYDIPMCSAMGLNLYQSHLFDTMYAAYLLRLEPQGLKPLAYRWCDRMRMASYSDTVGDAGRVKQLEYISLVASDPQFLLPQSPRLIEENDGTTTLYTPQPIGKVCKRILSDIEAGKLDKDGNPPDPYSRWYKTDPEQRHQVESILGRLPIGTLDDIHLDKAVLYSSKDADVTLRLYHALVPELKRHRLTTLMNQGMEVLPVFCEMQETGMPVSRSYFTELYDRMTREMGVIQSRISNRYFDSKPINPGSPKDTEALLRKRRLHSGKYTPTGAVATGKKAIEQFRFTDPAISDTFDWRERQHVKDSFCSPILERVPANWEPDIYNITYNVKNTRTATRRLATTDINILAIPSRTELGLLIRNGFIAPPGYLFAEADHSQIEMRVMADESGDDNLCTFFRNGQDIHAETAARIFGIPLDTSLPLGTGPGERYHAIPKDKRRSAKTANFGMIYGIQEDSLLTQLQMLGITGWTKRSVREQLIDEILNNVFPGIKSYMLRTGDDVRRDRDCIVRDRWGMPRHLPGIHSADPSTRAEAERTAVSHRIQGGAQGMIQRVIAHLKPHIRDLQSSGIDIRWLMEYHDSLLFLIPDSLEDYMRAIVLDAMINHCGTRLRVPIESDWVTATTWGGLK